MPPKKRTSRKTTSAPAATRRTPAPAKGKVLVPKKTLQNLRKSQKHLDFTLTTAQLGLWEWDIIRDKVMWSSGALAILGVDTKSWGHGPEAYYTIVHPDDADQLRQSFARCLATRSDFYSEHRIILPDGTTRWLEGHGRLEFNKKKEPVKLCGTLLDVTGKKNLEQEREDWKYRHELVAASTGIVVYDYDIASGHIAWSGNLRKVLGYSPHRLDHIDKWVACLHPDDHARAVAQLDHAQQHLKPYDVYYRFLHRNGSYKYLHDRGFFLAGSNGQARRMLGMMHDISEWKQAEITIRESEQSYRDLFNSVDEAIYLQKPDGSFIDVNAGACRMYGYPREAFIGKRPDFLSAPGRNDFDALVAKTQAALQGKSQSFEWWGLKMDGTIFLKEVHLTRGTYFGQDVLIATAWDITDRRAAEEALRESEKRFRNLTRDINIGVLLLDKAARILLANEAAINLLGISEDQLQGISSLSPSWRVVHENGSPFSTDVYPVSIAMATRRPVRGVVMGVHRAQQQDLVWLLVNAEPILDDKENVSELVVTFTDITERRKIEDALKESEQRFRTLQQASFGGIGLHDQGTIIDCNQGLSDITGYTYDELVGMNGLLLVAEEDRHVVIGNIKAGYEKPYDVRGMRKDGSHYFLEIHARNLPYKGRTIRVTEFRDVTDRRLTEEKMREQNTRLLAMTEDLKRKNEQMEEFTQIVSHNLRSPVGNILTLLNFFENADTEAEKAEYLNLLKESGTTTLTTLHELNEVLQIKQNKNIEKQELQFARVFQHVYTMLNAKISELDAQVTTDFTEAPTVLYPNIYLESILLNLLSNALKYVSPHRKPAIHIRTYRDQQQIKLEVSDNGLGINLERYGHQVFKLRKTFHRHPESRGIGLFMIKNQIEALGGEIKVNSRENEGATFTVLFYKHHEDGE